MARTDGMSRAFGARVAENVLPLSEEQDDLDLALDEWTYTGECIDHEEPFERCQMCAKDGLRYHFLIENDRTDKALWVGSECITRFGVDAIGPGGEVVRGEAAIQLVTADRQRMIEDARRKRVAGALHAILSQETDARWHALLESCLAYIRDKEGFTPKQMAVIAWRAKARKVRHSPRDFKVKLRRDDHKDQVRYMDDWKYHQLRPYLSPEQRKRADKWRGFAA